MISLDKLNDVVINRKPTDVETVLYLFWEKGISYEQFSELPVPYILSVLKVYNYVKKEEEKAMKKAQRKK